MRWAAQKAHSAPVIDKTNKLVGTVSREQLHRKVGGLGHDPKTCPVEPETDKENALCFSDQNVAEAEELIADREARRSAGSQSRLSFNRQSHLGKNQERERTGPAAVNGSMLEAPAFNDACGNTRGASMHADGAKSRLPKRLACASQSRNSLRMAIQPWAGVHNCYRSRDCGPYSAQTQQSGTTPLITSPSQPDPNFIRSTAKNRPSIASHTYAN